MFGSNICLQNNFITFVFLITTTFQITSSISVRAINNHETRKILDLYLFAFFIFTIDRIENCSCSVEELLNE